MKNKKHFSLVQLDEYAKRLTKHQANMLYENRMHKKFKNMLCEAQNINDDDYFSVYLDNSAFEGQSKAEIMNIIMGLDESIQSRMTPTGIYFFTDLPDVYGEILTWFKNNGMADYVDNVEKGFEKYLVEK